LLKVDISHDEIRRLIEEMLNEGLICKNKTW